MSKCGNVTRKIGGRRRYGGNNRIIGNRVGNTINKGASTADNAAGRIVGTVQGTGKYLANTASGVANTVGSNVNRGATMFNDTVDMVGSRVTGAVGNLGEQVKNTLTPTNTTGGIMMNSNPNVSLYNQEEEEDKPWWKFWGGRRRKTKKRNNKRRKTKSHKRKGNKSKRKVNKRRSNKRGGGKVPVHGAGHHRPHGYGDPYLASKNHLQGLSPSGHNSKLTMSRVRPDGMIDGLGGGSRKRNGGGKVPVHGAGHHRPHGYGIPYLASKNHLQGLSASRHNSKLTMSRVRPDGMIDGLGGGYRKRKGGKKRMKGGGGPAQPWMSQDLVNAYRGTIGNGVDALNTWQGRPENISANPYPTQKQLYGQDIKVLGRKYPDISANYDTATSTVASL